MQETGDDKDLSCNEGWSHARNAKNGNWGYWKRLSQLIGGSLSYPLNFPLLFSDFFKWSIKS